jgi:hypothetical protein
MSVSSMKNKAKAIGKKLGVDAIVLGAAPPSESRISIASGPFLQNDQRGNRLHNCDPGLRKAPAPNMMIWQRTGQRSLSGMTG